MNLCSKHHEEICFESRECPYCEKIEDFEKDIDERNDEISNLKSIVVDLQDEIDRKDAKISNLKSNVTD